MMKTFIRSYPAKFTKEPEGGYSVGFLDVSEAHTQGKTRGDAFRMAIDCLQACIEYRLEAKEEIPAASMAKRGHVAIPVAFGRTVQVSVIPVD